MYGAQDLFNSGYYGGENSRVEAVLRLCERKEHYLHKRLSSIINSLLCVPGVSANIMEEIEDIYIQKGVLYCMISYKIGYQDAVKQHDDKKAIIVNKLT